jgi:glycosyltransferase involved in cell wall biosynthesis
MHYIANGTDLPDKLAEGKKKSLLFTGGLYGPNITAAQALANQAHLLPEYTINIVGACGDKVITSQPNVRLYGHVDDEALDKLHLDAFAFVNLMQTGSGTSLKVARAMSYGLPVISTEIGARGYVGLMTLEKGEDITRAIAEVEKNWRFHSQRSRNFAEKFSWGRIGVKFRGIVRGG